MHASSSVRFKICCIASIEEARTAISHGASAVGLVSEMPSGPGPIPEEQIAVIAAAVPPGVATFLLTSKQNARAIIAQHRRTGTSALQMVDEFPVDQYRILRNELRGVKLVQVVHIQNKNSVQQALQVSEHVDALLLDSGNPGLARKELGGTGRVHDWSVSREIREQVDVPVYLAGGLTPLNVRQAIETVRPFAVDVCSGVRSDGKLDQEKLAAFAAAVRSTSGNG